VKTCDIVEQWEQYVRAMEIAHRHRSTMRKVPIEYMFPYEIVAANKPYRSLRNFRPNRRTPVTLKTRRARKFFTLWLLVEPIDRKLPVRNISF
jgi:hypothetical protein